MLLRYGWQQERQQQNFRSFIRRKQGGSAPSRRRTLQEQTAKRNKLKLQTTVPSTACYNPRQYPCTAVYSVTAEFGLALATAVESSWGIGEPLGTHGLANRRDRAMHQSGVKLTISFLYFDYFTNTVSRSLPPSKGLGLLICQWVFSLRYMGALFNPSISRSQQAPLLYPSLGINYGRPGYLCVL